MNTEIGYQEVTKTKLIFKILISFFLSIFFALILFTQLIAHSFEYSPLLGNPIWQKIYPPWEGVVWYLQAGNRHYYIFSEKFKYATWAGLIFFGVSLWFAISYRPLTKGNKSLHGTAKWAGIKDIKKTRLLDVPKGRNAVIVGGYQKKKTLHYLYHQGPEHVLCFAPSRSGKGVALMLPTLFTWQESVVVLDVKGEGWALTSGWRKNYAKNKVLRFDATDDTENGVHFNPLEEIQINTEHDVADAQIIANMIVDPSGEGLQDHWQKTSFALLTGVILHLLYKHQATKLPPPNLPNLVDCLSNPDQLPADFFAEMQNNNFYNNLTHPIASAAAQDQLNRAEREASSVLSSVISYLTLYRDPVLAQNISKSDFKIKDLMNHEQAVSLYLILRPSSKERLMPLIRLIITLITTKLTHEMEFKDGAVVAHYKHRLLLLLDEFTALRKMDLLEQQLPFLAGYGIKCFFLIQDLKQLYRWYTRDESIISNCHIRIAFASNEITTAEYLSRSTGNATIIKTQISASGNRISPMLNRVNHQYTEIKRALLTPDEVMRFPTAVKDKNGKIVQPGQMLIFVSGELPIKGIQPLYFIDKAFSERSKVPPPVVSDSLLP